MVRLSGDHGMELRYKGEDGRIWNVRSYLALSTDELWESHRLTNEVATTRDTDRERCRKAMEEQLALLAPEMPSAVRDALSDQSCSELLSDWQLKAAVWHSLTLRGWEPAQA